MILGTGRRVVDASVVVSALIVTLEPNLLTPAFVYDEIENYEELIVEKSGMNPDRVAQFVSETRMELVEFDQHVSSSVVNGLFEGNRSVWETASALDAAIDFSR